MQPFQFSLQSGLKVGERLVNNNGKIFKEYVPLPPERYPWKGMLEKKIERWLAEMRSSDFYITPPKEEVTCPLVKKRVSRGSGRTWEQHEGCRQSRRARGRRLAVGDGMSCGVGVVFSDSAREKRRGVWGGGRSSCLGCG